MNVITDNDIVVIGQNDTYDADIYLYANGDESEFTKALKKSGKLGGGPKPKNQYFEENKFSDRGVVGPKKEPTPAEKEEAKKKGLTWDNVNKVYIKAKELGFIDALLSKIGITPQASDVPQVGVNIPQSGEVEKKGMSTTAIVLIGVAVVGVVGFALYSSKKK
jgi:hypothetical protein